MSWVKLDDRFPSRRTIARQLSAIFAAGSPLQGGES